MAENVAGSSESNAEIIVQKKQTLPFIQKKLKSTSCQVGEKVVMEIEAGGNPEPKIIWFKDQKPIGNEANRQIRQYRGHSSLVIPQVKVIVYDIIVTLF